MSSVTASPVVIKSIQKGLIGLANSTSGTATITAVNTAKAKVEYNGWICADISTPSASSQPMSEINGSVVLTNGTTVTGHIGTSGVTINVSIYFTVTEFT